MKVSNSIRVEIGYAYYAGDLKVWDTAYVTVKNKAFTKTFMDRAKEKFANIASKLIPDTYIAHYWVHNFSFVDEDEFCEACGREFELSEWQGKYYIYCPFCGPTTVPLSFEKDNWVVGYPPIDLKE